MKKNALKIGWLMVLPGCLFVVFFMILYLLNILIIYPDHFPLLSKT